MLHRRHDLTRTRGVAALTLPPVWVQVYGRRRASPLERRCSPSRWRRDRFSVSVPRDDHTASHRIDARPQRSTPSTARAPPPDIRGGSGRERGATCHYDAVDSRERSRGRASRGASHFRHERSRRTIAHNGAMFRGPVPFLPGTASSRPRGVLGRRGPPFVVVVVVDSSP